MELKRPFTEEDWEATPKPVRQYIIQLEDIVIKLFHESACIFAVLKETLVVFHRRNFILEFGDLLFDFAFF